MTLVIIGTCLLLWSSPFVTVVFFCGGPHQIYHVGQSGGPRLIEDTNHSQSTRRIDVSTMFVYYLQGQWSNGPEDEILDAISFQWTVRHSSVYLWRAKYFIHLFCSRYKRSMEISVILNKRRYTHSVPQIQRACEYVGKIYDTNICFRFKVHSGASRQLRKLFFFYYWILLLPC